MMMNDSVRAVYILTNNICISHAENPDLYTVAGYSLYISYFSNIYN